MLIGLAPCQRLTEGQQAMNSEESFYHVSCEYDRFLGTCVTYCVKNRKKNRQLLPTNVSVRDQNIAVKIKIG